MVQLRGATEAIALCANLRRGVGERKQLLLAAAHSCLLSRWQSEGTISALPQGLVTSPDHTAAGINKSRTCQSHFFASASCAARGNASGLNRDAGLEISFLLVRKCYETAGVAWELLPPKKEGSTLK